MSGLFGEELQSEEEMVAEMVRKNPERYRETFGQWLAENFHIFKRFMEEADKIRATGRKHYSAHAIGGFLRHQTALRERDGAFKLNDHALPDCARLYIALRPEAGDFFELRRKDRKEAACES